MSNNHLKRILGEDIYRHIEDCHKSFELNELRIREGQPILVRTKKELYPINYLGGEIIATKKMIDDIFFEFCDHSIFTFENQLKSGFVSNNGLRLGIAGEGVFNGKFCGLKNISSLVIRVPNEVSFSSELLNNVYSNLCNTLIIAPVGAGKTSFLRFLLKNTPSNLNAVVIDERAEISLNSKSLKNCDVLKFVEKREGFEIAIRSLAPDIIACDEIYFEQDLRYIQKANCAGIAVFATFHGINVESFKNSVIYKEKLFEKYVILKKNFTGSVII